MSIEDYRDCFVVGSLALMLLAAFPTLALFIRLPSSSERFSEFWILGPSHKAGSYPFNIIRNQSYSVFLGIGNHLGYCAYYLVEVKFRNQTQAGPSSFNRTSSSLQSLFNTTSFVADGGTWELPIAFSFDFKYNETFSHLEFYDLKLNNITIDMKDYRVGWDSAKKGFLSNLFFELWIFDATSNVFRYHERFVGLWLNMTDS
jgi:uncharacterized membrane protein